VAGRLNGHRIPPTKNRWGRARRLPAATLQMMAYFSFRCRMLITPKHVVIAFTSLSQGEFKYAYERQLSVTLDGARLDPGEMKISDSRPRRRG